MNQTQRQERWPGWLLYIGFFAAVSSVLGYATFGRHPGWLEAFSFAPQLKSWVMAFYGISFRLFGEGLSWLFVLLLTLYLHSRIGWRWLPAAALVYVLSLGCELAGTVWGIPFGSYRYTALMGAAWGGHVPYVIPASWWLMALPAYAMATSRYSGFVALSVGALWLTMWDVSLDPAMSYLTHYWVWSHPGSYTFYGMPLQNWLGWYVTSFLLMVGLRALRIERWLPELSLSWLVAFYFLNVFIPFGMLVAAGEWGAVIVNVALYTLCIHFLMPHIAWVSPSFFRLKEQWQQR